MARPELSLGRQLCFLVYRLERETTARYRPLLRAIGLTYPQYLVMLVLWERRVETVGGICAALHLDTGTISPILKRLQAIGLVERKRDQTDERLVCIHLSAAGGHLEEKAAAIPGQMAACTGLDAPEYQSLFDALSARLAVLDGQPS